MKIKLYNYDAVESEPQATISCWNVVLILYASTLKADEVYMDIYVQVDRVGP